MHYDIHVQGQFYKQVEGTKGSAAIMIQVANEKNSGALAEALPTFDPNAPMNVIVTPKPH